MSTKITNKKAPQQPAKQSHYCEVLMAVQAAHDFYTSLGYRLTKGQYNSILAGIFLPNDPNESPCSYFDFKNADLAYLDLFLRDIRSAIPIHAGTDPKTDEHLLCA